MIALQRVRDMWRSRDGKFVVGILLQLGADTPAHVLSPNDAEALGESLLTLIRTPERVRDGTITLGGFYERPTSLDGPRVTKIRPVPAEGGGAVTGPDRRCELVTWVVIGLLAIVCLVMMASVFLMALDAFLRAHS